MQFKEDSVVESRLQKYDVRKIAGAAAPKSFSFIPYPTFVEETRAKAQREKWSPFQLQKELGYLNTSVRGGVILIELEHVDEPRVNAKAFEIAVQDKNRKDAIRLGFMEDTPKYSPISKKYTNTLEVKLPRLVAPPFYVQLIDRLSPDPPVMYEITGR